MERRTETMRLLWLMPPSSQEGEIPLVSQNRWFKYMPSRVNFIYPVLASYGVSMLKEAGFDVDFLDAPAEKVSFAEIYHKIHNYDLLILECRTAIMPWLWKVVHELKARNPSLRVVAYGDHVMVKPQDALEHGFDFVVDCGDWDYGILMLAYQLEAEVNPPPIFKVPLTPDLNHLPLLDRMAVNWRNYFESWRHRENFGWIQSGRGCWAKCSYCSWNYTYYHLLIRTMSSEVVFREILNAYEKYGITEFLDDADTFMMKPLGCELAAKLLSENMDVFWNVQTRADVVAASSLDELQFMRKSGLHVVKLGVDAGNDYSLFRIHKGCSAAQVKIAVEKLKKAGIEVHINMILGYPWEDKKTAYDSVKFVRSLKPNQAQFGLLQPFIGTPLFNECIENDWFVIDPQNYESWNMKTPIVAGEMTAKEISELYRYAWSSFYFSSGFILRQLFKACRTSWRERNLDTFRHLWRGFKAVRNGHLKAVK